MEARRGGAATASTRDQDEELAGQRSCRQLSCRDLWDLSTRVASGRGSRYKVHARRRREPADADELTAEDEELFEELCRSEEAHASVQCLSGIGPAYAAKLRAAGIETVGTLAGLTPEAADELAVAQRLPVGVLRKCCEQARDLAGG